MVKNTIKCALAVLSLALSTAVFSQNIAINLSGNPSLNTTAILDLSDASNNKLGLLLPNVSIGANNAFAPFTSSPLAGTIVWNTNALMTGGLGVGFYYWTGTQWNYLYNSGSATGNFINNQTTVQALANFNIGANGLIGGTFGVTGLSTLGAVTTVGAASINGSGANATIIGNGTNAITENGNVTINGTNGAATTNIGTGTTTGNVSIGGTTNNVLLPKFTTNNEIPYTSGGNGTIAMTSAPALNNILYYNGTSPVWGGSTAALLGGPIGSVLSNSGANTPAWNLTPTASGQVLLSNNAGVPSWLTTGANGILYSNAGTPAWAVLGSLPAGAGILTVPNGGTGLSTITLNGLMYGNAAGIVNVLAPSATANYILQTTAIGGAPSWVNPATALSGNFILNQNSVIQNPGTFSIAGTGTLAGLLTANAGFTDVGAANINNTAAVNTTSINSIAGNTGAVSIGNNSTTTLTEAAATDNINASTGAANITNIGTGTTTGAVNIGNTTGGTFFPQMSTQYGVYYSSTAGGKLAQTAAGTTGQVLVATTAGAPTWGNTSGTAWQILGNVNTVASTSAIGTLANNNFIGTTNATDFVMAANGYERMRIANSSGFVGVGITAPTAQFEVTSNGDVPYTMLNTTSGVNKRIRLQYAYNGTVAWELGTDYAFNNGDNLYMYDRTTGTFGPIITNNGYMSIGGVAPTQPLDVEISNIATTARLGSTMPVCFVANSPMVGFNAYWGAGTEYASSGYAGMIQFSQNVGGGFQFLTAPSGTANTTATMTPWMTILNSGNIGIGTAAPSQMFQVNGTEQLGTLSATQGNLIFANTSPNPVTINSSNSTTAAYTMTLPAAQGAANTVLTNNGAGILSWAASAGGGVTSISAGTPGAITGSSGLTFSASPITTTGSLAIANTGVTAGSYGSSTAIPTFTVNGQGQLTAAGSVTITGVTGANNGLTVNAGTVQQGGALNQNTVVNHSSSNYTYAQDLGTGSVAGSGTFAVTNGGTGNTYMMVKNAGTAGNPGQVGIGTATPNASAALDITSTVGGVLLPRLTTAQRTAIAAPANGLVVFDITLNCVYVFAGTWTSIVCGCVGPTAPTGFTGTTTACNSLTTGYTIVASGGQTSTVWSVSPNTATINTSTLTTANITFPAVGIYVISATPVNSSLCQGTPATYTVTISTTPATPGIITPSTATPCVSTNTTTLTIAAVPGATSYNWTSSNNTIATIAGATTTATVTTTATAGTVTFSVTATNTCGTSAASTITLTSAAGPSGTPVISGSTPICAGSTGNIYTVPSVAGVTYTWTVPVGVGASFTGQGTNSINVTASSGGSGNITLVETNACGTGGTASFAVTVNAVTHNTASFTYTGAITTWTVPNCITQITITANGAQGGGETSYSVAGGLGASMKGTFTVASGQILKILVGGAGATASLHGGGGGGSFVTDNSNNPMCIAGGGGGAYYYTYNFDAALYMGGSTATSGNPGVYGAGNAVGGAGGTAGSGGGCAPQESASEGAGGGGLTGNGTNCYQTTVAGGGSFITGGTAGLGCSSGSGGNGGFGGGGAADWCDWTGAGGGGGYSGGGGGTYYGCGGGGGSYNGGTAQTNVAATNAGNGTISIQY